MCCVACLQLELERALGMAFEPHASILLPFASPADLLHLVLGIYGHSRFTSQARAPRIGLSAKDNIYGCLQSTPFMICDDLTQIARDPHPCMVGRRHTIAAPRHRFTAHLKFPTYVVPLLVLFHLGITFGRSLLRCL